MKKNLISIIIPMFNNASDISETIRSLQKQSYQHWEAICVDDGSTDDTAVLIRQFMAQDDRIFYYLRSELPKGGSHCRNIGARYANGEYLIFLDGDDLLTEKCLENRLSTIVDTNLDFVVFPMATFSNGHIIKIISDDTISDYKLAFASNHAAWQVTSPIYRRDFFDRVGGFDTSFQRLQDVEFGLRAIVKSNGNYKSLLGKVNPDCLYRISCREVKTNKYIIGLQQFDRFLSLVKHLYLQGTFSRKEISIVYLCLALSSYVVWLQGGKEKFEFKDIFVENDIKEYMRLKERICYNFVGLFYRIPKLQFTIVRILRRIVMKRDF